MKSLIKNKTNAVYDYAFVKWLEKIPMNEWMKHSPPFKCRLEYLNKINYLINQSKYVNVQGLEQFNQKHLINGTTQEFDESYFRHSSKRLRIFRGEYAYHRRCFDNWKFIEDGILEGDEFIIVSAPFCSTGDVHPEFYNILDEALVKGIPVIVDCAYAGTCVNFNLDVNHPAIESVSFSLTKGFGLGDIRSGIRYSNIDYGPIKQQNDYDHTVLHAAKIGLHMMEVFDFDYIPNKYRKSQVEVCNRFEIEPTKCMHLALGNDEAWSHFKIDDKYNRLGIRELVKAWHKREIN